MEEFFGFFERLFSGSLPFCLLIFVGIYLSVKTRFYQFKNLRRSFKLLKPQKTNGINSFEAVCNSLSATVGTGNIVGVAAALSIGGAGAVFWMWISALCGMIIKAAEIVLGVYYREKNGNSFAGGPMYYIKKGMPKELKFLGVIFAIVGVLATLFMGNMTQINSAVSGYQSGFLRIVVGVFTALLIMWTVLGGVKKITCVLSKVLPIMTVLYILLCMGVILVNYKSLPTAFLKIFIGAFAPKAVTMGTVSGVITTLSVGASKGIFSNEAGLGTSAIIHACAIDADVKKQGLFGVFEVFVDTIIICTLTALTILQSGVIIDYGVVQSLPLVITAFSTVYGNLSSVFLNIMLLFFAASSIVGWATYGIMFCKTLFGEKFAYIFIRIYPAFCVLGAVLSTEIVWKTAEFLNGIMVIINLFAVMFLSKKVITILKE